MNLLHVVFATSEAALGLALLAYPPVVVRLLFGAEIGGAGIIMSRVAGISLIALGAGCWPSRDAHGSASGALRAMSSYSLLATLYLGYLGLSGQWGWDASTARVAGPCRYDRSPRPRVVRGLSGTGRATVTEREAAIR